MQTAWKRNLEFDRSSFLSNGYEIWIWDDAEYPARPLLGFYNKASLQKLFFQKKEKESLHLAQINEKITGRHYQIAGDQKSRRTVSGRPPPCTACDGNRHR
jgi:type I restriction enzyme, R subunit